MLAGLASLGALALAGCGGSQRYSPQRRGCVEAPEGRYVQVAAGGNFTCAVRASGKVDCWGGDLRMPFEEPPDGKLGPLRSPRGVAEVVRIAAGSGHACAVRRGGDMACWGWDGHAVGGNILPIRTEVPVVAAAAGGNTTCAIDRQGALFCWGENERGQLGLGPGAPWEARSPTWVSEAPPLAQVSAAVEHTCGRTADGKVLCWGDSAWGRLGTGRREDTRAPAEVPGVSDAIDVSAGREHTCAARRNGRVLCWGNNNAGQLGDGTTKYRGTPAEVAGLDGVVQVAAGYQHSCALRRDGAVLCWGRGGQARVTLDAQGRDQRTPAPVEGLSDATQISVGTYHSCALRRSGAIFCWGSSDSYAIGPEC